MVRDLASLLAPVSEQSFLEHFLAKDRLHVKAAHPARAVPLFPWATINRLIQADALPADRLRVMRANIDLPAAMFRHKDGAQQLRAGALQALLPQGVSLVINGVSDIVPPVARLSDAIERRLGHRTWVNAYLSFGRGSALKAHWDEHDVLVLQVHGSKRWRSFGTPVPFPVAKHNPGSKMGTTVVWEGLLEPGDVLYLPRGEVHEAAVEGAHSVHLTVGIQTLCGIDYLGWLADQIASEVAVRKDLTRLGGEAALHQHEIAFKERLRAHLDSTSVADFLAAEDQKRRPRALLNMGLGEEITAATMLVPALRRRIPLSTESDDVVTVTIGGEPYRLSGTARRVLDLLVQRDGALLGQLVAEFSATIGENALREAVADLAKQGLVGLEPPKCS